MALLLSFDDGVHPIWTPKILDILAEFGVKATFFVIGQHIADNEDILGRMVDEEHTVGNHTWSHPRLTDLTDGEIWNQLRDTNHAISEILGRFPTVWRAPYFGRDERVDQIAGTFGLAHTGADIVPEDCFTDDAVLIAERVLHRHAAGEGQHSAIVSLHDGIPPDGGSSACTQSRQPTVDAVRMILESLA